MSSSCIPDTVKSTPTVQDHPLRCFLLHNVPKAKGIERSASVHTAISLAKAARAVSAAAANGG
ncbi:MAG: hypothetical protein AB7F98_05935 [Novosphingobium sp.]